MSDRNGHEANARVMNRRNILLGGTTLAASALSAGASTQVAQAQPRPAPAPAQVSSGQKPNILVIWGDDVGIANISAYSNGLMGYETPNIDRIGREGIKFLHYSVSYTHLTLPTILRV